MLSSRGALNMQTVLMECAAAQSKTSKRIFLLSEAEKVWAATAKAIRMLLIQNIPVQIPKIGSFWFEMKLVVTDGPLKYYQRIPRFGFHHTFMSTYSLDSMGVPCENLKVEYERLPIDQITAISGVGAQTVSLVLQELFLFIGEGLFNGKVLNVELPSLMNIVMKREKAVVTFHDTLADELFAIDSRKWPLAVREMASLARRPPSRSLSESRPSTGTPRARASSTSSSPRQSAQQQPKPLEPRPAFVSSAQAGRLFTEIQNLPQRTAPAKSAPQQRGGSRREPMKGRPTKPPVVETEEEESVYEVLSPERHNYRASGEAAEDEVFVVDNEPTSLVNEGAAGADVMVPTAGDDDQPASKDTQPTTPAVRPSAFVPPSRGYQSSTVREILLGTAALEDSTRRVGRKRFGDPMRDHLSYLFSSAN